MALSKKDFDNAVRKYEINVFRSDGTIIGPPSHVIIPKTSKLLWSEKVEFPKCQTVRYSYSTTKLTVPNFGYQDQFLIPSP